MLRLGWEKKEDSALRFLFMGAHCDDIEIGAGGTALALVERFPEAHFHWLVFASNPARAEEAEASAKEFLRDVKKENRHIEINRFRESFFPYIGSQIKEHFETIKQRIDPDVIFTHYREDRHQDHRLISDLTWNTYRDHLILEYEIPKYDGDLGRPNVYCPVSQSAVERKISTLMTCYPSQLKQQWFTDGTFEAMLRLRGIECKADTGLAEAFYASKIIMS